MKLDELQKCLSHPDVPLVSGIEQRAGMCLTCVEVRLSKIMEYETQYMRMKMDKEVAENKVKDAEAKVARVQAMLKAETEGVIAASNCLPETQNPYKEGDELCVMWLNGWQGVETRRSAGQAMAVVVWALQNLNHVKELALGYGHGEIGDKLGLVISKLQQFQSDGG